MSEEDFKVLRDDPMEEGVLRAPGLHLAEDGDGLRVPLWPSLAADSLGRSHTPGPGAWRVPSSAPRDFGQFYERTCGGRQVTTVGRRSGSLAPPTDDRSMPPSTMPFLVSLDHDQISRESSRGMNIAIFGDRFPSRLPGAQAWPAPALDDPVTE